MSLFYWSCNALTLASVTSKENKSTPVANGLRRKNVVEDKSPLTKRIR